MIGIGQLIKIANLQDLKHQLMILHEACEPLTLLHSVPFRVQLGFLAVAGDVFDDILFCAVIFPKRCLG